jgi:hypothetical protein
MFSFPYGWIIRLVNRSGPQRPRTSVMTLGDVRQCCSSDPCAVSPAVTPWSVRRSSVSFHCQHAIRYCFGLFPPGVPWPHIIKEPCLGREGYPQLGEQELNLLSSLCADHRQRPFIAGCPLVSGTVRVTVHAAAHRKVLCSLPYELATNSLGLSKCCSCLPSTGRRGSGGGGPPAEANTKGTANE